MRVKYKVYRYDSEKPDKAAFQDFELDLPESASVLEGLIKIREDLDGSLSLRCSCRSAICGSCAMRINGRSRLACKTLIRSLYPKTGEVRVEPMGNQPVLKDLVVDMTPFWNKVKAVKPWLVPVEPVPQREYLVPPEKMETLQSAMNCIMCGSCVSACTVLEVDKSFLGPAALAKAWRFVEDPRDRAARDRLEALTTPAGVWDCTHCFMCVDACPKGVAPMDKIIALRTRASESGFSNNNGTRHHTAIERSVRHTGLLNETIVTMESFGYFNFPALLKMAPTGIRTALRGKFPPPFHGAIPKVERVRQIFDKLSSDASAHPTQEAK